MDKSVVFNEFVSEWAFNFAWYEILLVISHQSDLVFYSMNQWHLQWLKVLQNYSFWNIFYEDVLL